MKKNLLLNRSLFLLFGIILVLPVFGINASPESTDFEVNPSDYTINVNIGDSRLYVFQQIRTSSFDEYNMMTEVHELTMQMEFGGITENRTINEGTKVRVEVVAINDSYIVLSQIYYLLDGPVYYPDNTMVNRSTLDLKDSFGPRMIMTTNDSLIHQVYDGIPEWKTEIQSDMVRFSRNDWNESYAFGSSEDYEYEFHDRFLRHLSIHESYENGHMDIEIRSSFEMNPNHYTLGVAVGDSQIFTLNKIKFYDWGQETYVNDIPITVKQGGSDYYYNLKQGDQIYLEITDTTDDYIKFLANYIQKDGPVINDETVHILDKTTGYFSFRSVFHGPPLLISTNTSLISEYAPMDFEITDGELKYYSSWEDTASNFKQTESGSWNLTTGWLNNYWREEIEQGIVRHEFEIIAGNYSSSEEYAVGVNPGDTNSLQFTEISMMSGDTTTDEFVLTTRVEDNERNITMKIGDTIDVTIKDVDGYQISLYMTFHSSVDGDVTGDSWTVNIAQIDEKNSNGPSLLVPTDPVLIDQMYKDIANVSYVGDKVFINSQHDDGSKTYMSEYVYDITTGWVTKITQTTLLDGTLVEKFVAESVGTSTSPNDSETNPSLTPVPLWPTIFFLIIAASFYRRKR